VDAELAKMIERLEAGVVETGRHFGSGGTVIAVGSVVVAGIAALREIWFLVPICLLFGASILALSRLAQRKNSPARAAPVLAALRDAPERVTKIVHMVTSDSHGVFVTHWITVVTADGRLHVRADDWKELLDALARRCPSAQVDRGPES
jgi:hypothetical protein